MPATKAHRVETNEYAAMLRRMVRSYGRRLADSDPTELSAAVKLQAQLDDTIRTAVIAMRDTHGFSWADIAYELGTTRQAAQQRYGHRVAV